MANLNKVYLNACCLNCPFEAEAVVTILRWIGTGKIKLLGSEMLKFDINRISNTAKKQQLLSLLEFCGKMIPTDECIQSRAKELFELGITGSDAFNVASAEKGMADYFITADERVLRSWDLHHEKISVRIVNPNKFVQGIISK
jgi:predicted nucleic acid-binding protein